MAPYNEYQPAGVIPQQPEEPDDTADPKTWDWSPIAVRDNLKRGNLERNCNDPFWAYALIIVVCSVIGFAVYGGLKADWSLDTGSKSTMNDAPAVQSTPAHGTKAATSTKDHQVDQDDAPKSMKGVVSGMLCNILLAGAFGIVLAYAWSHLLKRFAGSMIKISIFTFIGFNVALAVAVMCMGCVWYVSLALVLVCLCHVLWYWCVRHRIPMAEATLSIAVGRLHHYWSVTWISLGFSVLSIVWFVAMGLAYFGVYRFTGLIDENDTGSFSVIDLLNDDQRFDKSGMEWAYHLVIIFTLLVVLFWGAIALSYMVHATCAGVMGTWYFNNSRKRTVTDALVRACTTSLGSISFAAFILAIIRALEQLARQNERKAAEDGDMVSCLIACCIRCILQMIGDIINYLNSLALIRVAVYGEPFCVAAKRTMNMMKYRGMHQLINDDLSGMPVWLGCFICCLCCVPVMFGCYKLFPWLVIAHTVGEGTSLWAMAFVASLVALFIPMCVLGTISSFTQALYVLWGDDPLALDQEHPAEAKLLKSAAFSHYNYQVRYDDDRILRGQYNA